MHASDLLPNVKKNLVLDFDDDDSLLIGMVEGAVNYAEGFQNRGDGYYAENEMPPATAQAVVLLASYFYETRDATGGTFFAGSVGAIGAGGNNMWRAVNDLLRLNRDWKV
jgi:hypothetical protein